MQTGKKIKLILTLTCVAMAFIGITIFGFLTNQGKEISNKSTITINSETTKTLSAEIKNLYPGSESEYEISIKGKNANDYYITLLFKEKLNGIAEYSLKDYINVKISANDNIIEKPLKELLNGETISLGQNATSIKIIYTMAESAGNETQGKNINFYIDLTAKTTVG